MVKLFLSGDVMLGRGIDQIQHYRSDPILYEHYTNTAEQYVLLAEQESGPIPRAVAPDYVWGDALVAINDARPDLRIINLETAVTTASTPEPKGINYRMEPRNAVILKTFGIDCCSLANNHVLDWERDGLLETLSRLRQTGIHATGAGRDLAEAQLPAILEHSRHGRVIVLAVAVESSGVPEHWAAANDRSGVNFLRMDGEALRTLSAQLRCERRPGDIVIVSVHWGGNWGYEVPDEHVSFAHALIDEAGIDIVHGHSSHHPMPIEIYRGKPILYGCGDFLNDYEGFIGRKHLRGDLVLAYVVTFDAGPDRQLRSLSMIPFQIRKFRLNRASLESAEWLSRTLTEHSQRFGTQFRLAPDGTLAV